MDDRDLELLSAYLDGALNEGERQTLETRLAQDALLQRELDRLRETKRLVGSLPSLKAPRDLTIAQTARQARRQPLVLSPWVSMLSAVAAAFMLIAGFVLLNRPPTHQTGQEALSQTAISLAATPEAAQLRAVPTASGLPMQTATVMQNEESSTGRAQAQAQENQAAADEDASVTGETGAASAPALAPAPGSEMPFDALVPVAPPAADGSGEADQQQNGGLAQAATTTPAPEPAAALGAAAQTAASVTPPIAEQQYDSVVTPTSTAMPTLPASASATLSPTLASSVEPTPVPAAPSVQIGNDSGGNVLIVVGAILLLVAAITTLLRRRQIS